jgi:hypothetical protein
MKALLFTLLLLFIVISPSLTAPSGGSNLYKTRQRIIYTFFTGYGVFNVEFLYDPRITSLDRGFGRRNIDFIPGTGYTQIIMNHREVDRWDLDANPPRARSAYITANIMFTPPPLVPIHLATAYGVLAPGVTTIPLHTVAITPLTQRNTQPKGLYLSGLQDIYLVLMTVLLPGASDLDPQTRWYIQTGSLRAYIEAFLRGGAGASRELHQLPLRLDPEIWYRLLTNSMSEYQPSSNTISGAAPPDPAPRPPRPHHNEGCSGTSSRQHDKDDQDDPEAEREGKRQCRPSDLTKDPKDKGKAREANQGDQQVPNGWFRSALDRIKGFWAWLTAPRAHDNDPKTAYRVFWDDKPLPHFG